MAASETSAETLVTIAPAGMHYEAQILALCKACNDQDDGCRARCLDALSTLCPRGDALGVATAMVRKVRLGSAMPLLGERHP